MDLDEYREQSRASWAQMARGWADRRDWLQSTTRPVSDWLLARADPQPGEAFLDVATGTGDLAHELARLVGPGGRVVATDFSSEMLAEARRAGEALGLANVEHRLADAEHLGLPDASIDGATCRFGYMLMADPGAALRETRRVLRPGGRLAFVVWHAPDRNPWASVPAGTLVGRGVVPPPEPGAPGMFALADPERIRALAPAAGFGELELEEVAFAFRYADLDEFWGILLGLAGPLSRALAEAPEDERHAARAEIDERLAPFAQADGAYVVPAAVWGVLAR